MVVKKLGYLIYPGLRQQHKWEIMPQQFFNSISHVDIQSLIMMATTGFCTDRENKLRKNIPIFVYAYEKDDPWEKIADKYF